MSRSDKKNKVFNQVAFVLGTEEAIARIYKKIGIGFIHMRLSSKRQKQHIFCNLNLGSNQICAWCFHISREQIENHIIGNKNLKSRRIRRANVHKNFDRNFLRVIHNDLQLFATSFRKERVEIKIQTDFDMELTVKNWGLKNEYKGMAHELADAIAWFNQRRVHIPNCIVLDIRTDIRAGMEHDLFKR